MSKYGVFSVRIQENTDQKKLRIWTLFSQLIFKESERPWNDAILCIFDVIGLNPNISHEESSSFLKKHLDLRTEKEISTVTLVKLAKIVLKNNIFNFNLKTFRHKRGNAIGTTFSPPCSILFIPDLEERM